MARRRRVHGALVEDARGRDCSIVSFRLAEERDVDVDGTYRNGGSGQKTKNKKQKTNKQERWRGVPVVKDLLIRPLEESWYPPAHLGGTSERPAWPWWCASEVRAAKLREGAFGTPDASVRTVGGRVAYFFAAACKAAIRGRVNSE